MLICGLTHISTNICLIVILCLATYKHITINDAHMTFVRLPQNFRLEPKFQGSSAGPRRSGTTDSLYIYIHIYTYIYIYILRERERDIDVHTISVYIYIYIYSVYIYTHICLYMYTHNYIYIYIHIHMCIYTYMYIHVCIYIYVIGRTLLLFSSSQGEPLA